jgi:hypothetical protein
MVEINDLAIQLKGVPPDATEHIDLARHHAFERGTEDGSGCCGH